MYQRHFEAVVSSYSSSVALCQYRDTEEAKCMTYGELNTMSNRLARAMRNQLPTIFGPLFMGVCLSVLDEQLPVFLASLKLGCTFVPMETFHPAERNAQMLKQTKAFCVVTRREYDTFTERLEALPGLTVHFFLALSLTVAGRLF